MKELDDVLAAYEDAELKGDSCLLATLVKVDGSSYRRAGARILLTASGGKTGGVSGGCLEVEIAKKAWWLTENGPVLQQYNTVTDGESGMPYELGCNGVLHVLLQRMDAEGKATLSHLRQFRAERARAALATVISGPLLGSQRLYSEGDASGEKNEILMRRAVTEALQRAAKHARSEYVFVDEAEIFVEAIPPSQRVIVFGANDDVRPMVRFARVLGWHVVVADGRAHLATRARFPEANEVLTAPVEELAARCSVAAEDAIVLMTHSYPQDLMLLSQLIGRPVRYLGQLGPRQRTRRLLEEISGGQRIAGIEWRLHAPIGLDIGAHTPETIALAIIAEIQSVISDRDAIKRAPEEQALKLDVLV